MLVKDLIMGQIFTYGVMGRGLHTRERFGYQRSLLTGVSFGNQRRGLLTGEKFGYQRRGLLTGERFPIMRKAVSVESKRKAILLQ